MRRGASHPVGAQYQAVDCLPARELARAGLSAKTVDQHVETIRVFAQELPAGPGAAARLLRADRADLHTYLMTAGRGANRTSFKRFVRFLSRPGGWTTKVQRICLRVCESLVMALVAGPPERDPAAARSTRVRARVDLP